jgi:Flp pilus assembly protein TadG
MAARYVHRIRSFLGHVLCDRRGAAAMLFALAIVPVFASVGLAVDSSLGYLLRSRMSKALDTAGLAAGRLALNTNAEEVARQYFDANFDASGGSVELTSCTFELAADRKFVTLTAEADSPTIFMRVFGKDTMTVSSRTVIRRETTGMELALVLDNTGSMWGTAFDGMQQAAFDLIEILYGEETEIDNLWVSLVPYTATINVGSGRTGWLAGGDRVFTNPGSFSTPGWKGCVQARATPLDTNDTPPSGGAFTSYFYASTARTQDNRWDGSATYPLKLALSDRNDGRGPNLGCGPAITPLTPSRATIDAGIANMGPWHRGGTTGNLGLSWGWRTISPQWRGLWGGETPATHPLDYGTPFMDKVVVILTDGQNQFYDHDSGAAPGSDYTAYGRLEALGVTTLAQGRAVLDGRMASTCGAMKAEGIRIYAITFGGSPDATAQALFRNCASTPAMYYHAPTNAILAEVFTAIGGELANLRIVE